MYLLSIKEVSVLLVPLAEMRCLDWSSAVIVQETEEGVVVVTVGGDRDVRSGELTVGCE